MRMIRNLICMSLITLSGCSPRISLFDQYAYTQVTSIKVDAIMVMGDATKDYTSSTDEIQKVDISIRKIIEYEKHRPANTITTEIWEKLNDPKNYLYGGFIARWKEKGKLDSTFVVDQQKIVGLAFDQIAELESGKIKSK